MSCVSAVNAVSAPKYCEEEGTEMGLGSERRIARFWECQNTQISITQNFRPFLIKYFTLIKLTISLPNIRQYPQSNIRHHPPPYQKLTLSFFMIRRFRFRTLDYTLSIRRKLPAQTFYLHVGTA